MIYRAPRAVLFRLSKRVMINILEVSIAGEATTRLRGALTVLNALLT